MHMVLTKLDSIFETFGHTEHNRTVWPRDTDIFSAPRSVTLLAPGCQLLESRATVKTYVCAHTVLSEFIFGNFFASGINF